MSDISNAELRRLSDLEDVRDLARRYAHYVWLRDADAAIDLFADDGEMDMGDRPSIIGREALQTTYREVFEASVFLPFVHGHVVELDGDKASGTVYLDLRSTDDGKSMTGHGYYNDRYTRTDKGWRFAYRKLTLVEYREI